jgi:hypothetical protein
MERGQQMVARAIAGFIRDKVKREMTNEQTRMDAPSGPSEPRR